MDSRQQMRNIIGNCAFCGYDGPPSVTESEAAKFVAMYSDPDLHPVIRKAVHAFRPMCDKCADRQDAKREAQTLAERVRLVTTMAYNRDMLPAAARQHTFERSNRDYEARNPDVWAYARAWEPRYGNFWLQGRPGVGKTYLTHCVANQALSQGISAGETTGHRLCEVAGWQFNERLRKAWSECELLVLQDVEKANWDAGGLRFLFDILDRRLSAERRIAITANATPEEMHKRWSNTLNRDLESATVAALFERLLPIKRLEMTGESIRREMATAVAEDEGEELF